MDNVDPATADNEGGGAEKSKGPASSRCQRVVSATEYIIFRMTSKSKFDLGMHLNKHYFTLKPQHIRLHVAPMLDPLHFRQLWKSKRLWQGE